MYETQLPNIPSNKLHIITGIIVALMRPILAFYVAPLIYGVGYKD